jgi:hypothetical protein
MTTDAATAPPLCALHPALPSAGTCARCGRFACERCFHPGTGRCVECDLRTDPLGVRAGPFSISRSLESGWKLFRTAPSTAAGISVAAVPITWAMSFVSFSVFAPPSLGDDPFWRFSGTLMTILKQVIFSAFLHGVLLAQMAASAQGEPITVFQAIGRSARAWPRMAWATLVAIVLTVLGMVACIVPGVYAAVTLWVVLPAAYLEPDSPAAETSSELTRGRKWELFGLLLLLRVPVLGLSAAQVVVNQVLARVEIPMEQRATLLSAIGVAVELLSALAEAFSIAVILAAYLRLRAQADAEAAAPPATLAA